MSLADRSCAPCPPGTPPLGADARLPYDALVIVSLVR